MSEKNAAKLDWIQEQPAGRWFQFRRAAMPTFDECKPVLATHDVGAADDTYVNLAHFHAVAQTEDGTMLARREQADESGRVTETVFVLVSAPCGDDDGCGCGCEGGWRVVLLSPRRAARWLFDHGFPMTAAPDPEIKAAWASMLIE